MIKEADGKKTTVNPGETFKVRSDHDAWVIGDEPCIALGFKHLS